MRKWSWWTGSLDAEVKCFTIIIRLKTRFIDICLLFIEKWQKYKLWPIIQLSFFMKSFYLMPTPNLLIRPIFLTDPLIILLSHPPRDLSRNLPTVRITQCQSYRLPTLSFWSHMTFPHTWLHLCTVSYCNTKSKGWGMNRQRQYHLCPWYFTWW